MDPINVKDLAGFSQPLEKLIEVISKGVGTIYNKNHIRDIAKAEKDAAIINAEASAEVSLIQARAEAEKKVIEWQASERLKFLAERRQKNINNIVDIAAKQLPETINSVKSVEEDWIARFFEVSQDTSNEEMQLLWGRLLAGEVANPGSFSLRTIQSISLFSPQEARLFSRFCRYVWEPHMFFWYPDFRYYAEHVLHDVNVIHLESIGLINTHKNIRFSPDSPEGQIIFTYFGRRYLFRTPGNEDIVLQGHLLTQLGKEIFPLCQARADDEYLKAQINFFKKTGLVIKQI